jgi:L-fuconolactonase
MALDVSGHYRYPPPEPSWLALHVEDVLCPELPIIDPHHHLWIEDGKPYLGLEIMEDLKSGHRIESTVFVQAHYGYRSDLPPELAPVGETEKVRAISASCHEVGCRTRVAEGIVAFADLTLGSNVEHVIAAHAIAADGALRGVRHGVSRDSNFPDGIVVRPAPAGLLKHDRYREGLRVLQQFGLSYDAMLYHEQISELSDLAMAMPDLPIILDHMGTMLGVGPYETTRNETFAQWRHDMAELARSENVTVKIGGMGMIICGARWHERARPPSSDELAADWRSQVETCIELFGAERCMFESNFPVDKAMYSYRTLWNAFKRLTSGASINEREALFAGTAARTYRIAIPAKAAHAETSHV